MPAYSSAGAAPNLASDIENAVRGTMLAEICAQASNHSNMRQPTRYRKVEPKWFESEKRSGFDYGPCGRVEVSMRKGEKPREADTSIAKGDPIIGAGPVGIITTSQTAYRVNAVDYEAIASATHAAALNELKLIQQRSASIVQSLFTDPQASHVSNAAMARAYAEAQQLERESRARLNHSIASSVDSERGAIQDSTLQFMKDGGWMLLGTHYPIFAEVSNAITDAQRAFQITFQPGNEIRKLADGGRAHSNAGLVTRAIAQFSLANAAAEGDSGKGFFDRVLDKALPANTAGERSVGQQILVKLTEAVAADSGGAGLVNPVIAAKNLGDWLVATAQAGLTGAAVAGMVPVVGLVAQAAAIVMPTLGVAGELIGTALWIMLGVGGLLDHAPMVGEVDRTTSDQTEQNSAKQPPSPVPT